ncbi:MAG: DUF11 domain-containing protein [Chloroflexi bacterium]|nr:DUF11 domain-containing protein [Chloroflexota bacterium]
MKVKRLIISFALGLVSMLALVYILNWNTIVSADVKILNPSAVDRQVCLSGCAYSSVQDAVDAADSSDTIKVAAGTYTGVDKGTFITQMVRLRVNGVPVVTIRGGYTTTNWVDSDPVANPTILDAEGQGRVFFIEEGVNVTIEGLRITGGNAYMGDVDGGRKSGGGLYAADAVVTLRNNHLYGNVADKGGAVYLSDNGGVFIENTVTDNTANHGGGLFLDENRTDFSYNTISTNTAVINGGGLLLLQSGSIAALESNTIIANTAVNGGGMYLSDSDALLVNNVIANNSASTIGGGLYINVSAPLLLHTVIAQNGVSGVYAKGDSTVSLVNTILSSHTVGISVTGNSEASLNATLWYANDENSSGNVVHTNNHSGDPDFDAPNAGDYHIGILSMALDRGVDEGVLTDIDGDTRPRGRGYDIGADEYPDLVSAVKLADPLVARPGERLTYTIRVTNYSTETYTANITDTLPDHIMFTAGITSSWIGQIIYPGVDETWTRTIVVTAQVGYSGLLTNTVDVTTDADEIGAAKLVIGCYPRVHLPLVLRLG